MMNLRQFLDSLTPEQKAYFTNYVAQTQDKTYEHGKNDGYRQGLFAARNAINERFGL